MTVRRYRGLYTSRGLDLCLDGVDEVEAEGGVLGSLLSGRHGRDHLMASMRLKPKVEFSAPFSSVVVGGIN